MIITYCLFTKKFSQKYKKKIIPTVVNFKNLMKWTMIFELHWSDQMKTIMTLQSFYLRCGKWNAQNTGMFGIEMFTGICGVDLQNYFLI